MKFLWVVISVFVCKANVSKIISTVFAHLFSSFLGVQICTRPLLLTCVVVVVVSVMGIGLSNTIFTQSHNWIVIDISSIYGPDKLFSPKVKSIVIYACITDKNILITMLFQTDVFQQPVFCAFHHGENSSAKRLCYTHIFCIVIVMFLNDLHICSKRHYHDINFPGRAVAFEWGSGGGPRDYLPKKTNIFAILIPTLLQGMPTQVTKWIQIVRFAKKLHFSFQSISC